MQEILFTPEECRQIRDSRHQAKHSTILSEHDRAYTEWLITEKPVLDLVLEKIKHKGVVFLEEARVLEYKKGGFFETHIDTWWKYPDRLNTLLIQLSDFDEYEGGVMKVDDIVFEKNIGNTIMFDGKTSHGMSRLTDGTRYVFVLWLERKHFNIAKNFI